MRLAIILLCLKIPLSAFAQRTGEEFFNSNVFLVEVSLFSDELLHTPKKETRIKEKRQTVPIDKFSDRFIVTKLNCECFEYPKISNATTDIYRILDVEKANFLIKRFLKSPAKVKTHNLRVDSKDFYISSDSTYLFQVYAVSAQWLRLTIPDSNLNRNLIGGDPILNRIGQKDSITVNIFYKKKKIKSIDASKICGSALKRVKGSVLKSVMARK